MIEGENSILPILTFDAQTDWASLYKIADPHLEKKGLARLIAALNTTAKCVVVEREYIDKDYRDTFSHFHSKRFSTPNSRCLRLHFFSNNVTKAALAEASGDRKRNSELNQVYLGYSVIRPTKPNCIGRTFLTPASRGPASAYACLCDETVSILGTELGIKGFPFISQDADVTVCAESAVWMMLRYFSNRYHLYPEIYPFQVVNLTKDYSLGRIVPSTGLYIWQMAESMRRIGRPPLIYTRKSFKEKFDHLLYTYIESGIPVLAGLKDHVVVAFGHSSVFSNKIPGNDAIYSSAFNDAFVINDDNYVPYQLLHKDAKKTGSGAQASEYKFEDIVDFIAPLPEKVFLSAEDFETVVTAILDSQEFGVKALSASLAKCRLVFRMFLTTGKSFKKRLKERNMGNQIVETVYRDIPLPHFMWVCEISTVDAFSRHEICGEILWDATRNAREPNGWIALHYPEILVVDTGSALNGDQDLKRVDLDESTNYQIYKNNLFEI